MGTLDTACISVAAKNRYVYDSKTGGAWVNPDSVPVPKMAVAVAHQTNPADL